MGKRVLDVGNGGISDFFSPSTKLFVGLDFSLLMLKSGNGEVERVCGDALDLPFREEVFNTILYRSLLHHLTGERICETKAQVKRSLREGYFLLEKGGNVIIIDHCIPDWLEKIEKILYLFIKIFFMMVRQSEVFLFSVRSLCQILEESGFEKISFERI